MNQNSLEEESIYVDPRTKIRYRYFDILLNNKSQEPEFCFVIENKIDAVPEIKQLVAYKKLIDINFKQYTNRSVILFDYESPLERANRLTKSKISNKEDKQWLMRNSIKSWKEERDRTFNFIEWDKLSKVLFKNSKQIQKDFPKEENNIFKQFLEYIWRDRQMGSDFRGMDTFDEINNPYSHEKAKGILRSLVNDKYLKDTYTKMDFKFRDRLTIWDRGVWDVIYQSPSHFTNKPHFGVSLQLGNIFTIDFTIPHQAPNAWKLLAELIKDNKLAAYLNEIRQNVPELWIRIDQRHSRGGQKLIEDAKIEFKWDLTMEKSISENNSFRVYTSYG